MCVWEGTQPGQLALTDQRDIPCRMILCSAMKIQGKEEEWAMVLVMLFIFPSNCYVYRGPALQKVAGHLPDDGKQ